MSFVGEKRVSVPASIALFALSPIALTQLSFVSIEVSLRMHYRENSIDAKVNLGSKSIKDFLQMWVAFSKKGDKKHQELQKERNYRAEREWLGGTVCLVTMSKTKTKMKAIRPAMLKLSRTVCLPINKCRCDDEDYHDGWQHYGDDRVNRSS